MTTETPANQNKAPAPPKPEGVWSKGFKFDPSPLNIALCCLGLVALGLHFFT